MHLCSPNRKNWFWAAQACRSRQLLLDNTGRNSPETDTENSITIKHALIVWWEPVWPQRRQVQSVSKKQALPLKCSPDPLCLSRGRSWECFPFEVYICPGLISSLAPRGFGILRRRSRGRRWYKKLEKVLYRPCSSHNFSLSAESLFAPDESSCHPHPSTFFLVK